MKIWNNKKLSEVADVIGGGTPSTNKLEYWEGNIPWITPKDLSGYNERYISKGSRNISQLGLQNSSARILPKGSVLLTSRAPIGYIAIAKNEVCTNQGFKSLVLKKGNDSDFFYYLLKNNIEYIKNMSSGSTFSEISGTQVKNLEFEIPPLETQQKIAKVLSAFDDKIELNNKINENLEQQAQAIFKSWFIDFEPFGGKMPTDWEKGMLGDFIEIKRGGSPRPIQNYISDKGYRWLKISDATSTQSPFIMHIKEHIKESGINKTVFLKAGSLVLSNSATPGIPKMLDVDSCIHDGWLYFPNAQLSNEYLYLLFQFIRPNLVAFGNGSVFTNLKTDILKQYNTILPDVETLSKFDNMVSLLFKKILNNVRENEHLIQLRDTLLPKLMNGEIDVENINI